MDVIHIKILKVLYMCITYHIGLGNKFDNKQEFDL